MIKTVKRMYCDHCGKEIGGRHVQFKGNDYHAECFEAAAVLHVKQNTTVGLSVFNPFSPMENFMIRSKDGPVKLSVSERYSEQFINACGEKAFKNNEEIISEVLANMVTDDIVNQELADACVIPYISDPLWALIQYNDNKIVRKAGYVETHINQSVQIWINPVSGEHKIYAGQDTQYSKPSGVEMLDAFYRVAKTHYEGIIVVLVKCLESTADFVYESKSPAFGDSDVSADAITVGENYDGMPLVKPPRDPRDGYKFDMFKEGV